MHMSVSSPILSRTIEWYPRVFLSSPASSLPIVAHAFRSPSVQVPLFIHASSTDRAVRRVSREAILGIRGSLPRWRTWQSDSVARSSTFFLSVSPEFLSRPSFLNELSRTHRKNHLSNRKDVENALSPLPNISVEIVAQIFSNLRERHFADKALTAHDSPRRNYALEFRKTLSRPWRAAIIPGDARARV